jgi:CheY-like chemotaxis protein
MGAKSVLIVEDDVDIRMSLRLALEEEGYVIHEAEHGVQALKVLAEIPHGELPGCIILDLMMPFMTGEKFLEVLSECHNQDWAKIPVVLATAKGSLKKQKNDLSRLERINKPMDLVELYRVVEKYCGKL